MMGDTLILNTQNMSFREQVRLVRMHLQISQKEFANGVGVSFATASRWENEDRKPQLAMQGKFYAFCRRNGIEIEQMGGENG